jgi:hypothetical protein
MAKRELPGLNVQAPWARMLLDGSKKIETRTYPLPSKYLGSEFWLIETPGRRGKFKSRIIGIICFSECKRYESSSEFYSDSDLHQVREHDLDYFWNPKVPKFGWIVSSIVAVAEIPAPNPRGLVYSSPFTLEMQE